VRDIDTMIIDALLGSSVLLVRDINTMLPVPSESRHINIVLSDDADIPRLLRLSTFILRFLVS